MYNLNEVSQQLDTLLSSLTNSPQYAGNNDRRLYEFYTLRAKMSIYTYCRFSQKTNQIENLLNAHVTESYRITSARLVTHIRQAQFKNTVIQTNIGELYQKNYLKTDLKYAFFMTREASINHIMIMEEMNLILTSLEKQDSAGLAPALQRYRQWLSSFKSNSLELMRGVGIMALVIGLHFTPLTLPFLICEIIAFSLLGTELILRAMAYHVSDPYMHQPEAYRYMVKIADDIEQTYNLKPPSSCSRFFSCFQNEPSVENRSLDAVPRNPGNRCH